MWPDLVLSQLAAKFLVDPEDEESMKKELREAFRIYDKAGKEGLEIARDKHPQRNMVSITTRYSTLLLRSLPNRNW